MNDFTIRSLADCYNGSLIREFDFAEPIGETLIMHLGRDKKLDYFPDLPKPYFRIEAKGKYILRGIRGSTTMRAVLKQPHPEMNLFSLKAALDDFFSPESLIRPEGRPVSADAPGGSSARSPAGSTEKEADFPGSSSGPDTGAGLTPRRTAAVPARGTPLTKKAVRKKVPNGFDSKHFSARWRLAYLTHRGSGA